MTPKNSTTQIIKYRIIRRIIYKQNVRRVNVEKFLEENIKVFMEYNFLGSTMRKLSFFLA